MAISASSAVSNAQRQPISNFNFIENNINKINYRTDQRKVESALIEKLICLTLKSGSYSPNEKRDLINQLTPSLETTLPEAQLNELSPEIISPKDQFRGFHSKEIELLAKIAKEKGYLNSNEENNLSIAQLIEDLQNAQGADEQTTNLLEGKGYSYLSTADKIFNSNLIRQCSQRIPGSFGNLLQLRCFEASVSVTAIALRELVKDLSQENKNPNVQDQREIVENTIAQKFPNNELLFSEEESILDTIFAPKSNDTDNSAVTLTLSPTLAALQSDLEKIDPQKQQAAAVTNVNAEQQEVNPDAIA